MASWKEVRDSLKDWAQTRHWSAIPKWVSSAVNASEGDPAARSTASPDLGSANDATTTSVDGVSESLDLTDAELLAKVRQTRGRLPIPVFWLLGKAQSGKTSIVRALTRNSRAEIGDGFRPCTQTASLYDFPDPEHSFVRFLDTRGLGEVAYNPHDDLQQFQDQAHLLMVVFKALDHAQNAVLDAVSAIHHQRPDWPIVVVQTTLHDGYPWGENHIQPYPYDQPDWARLAPQDLARSLQAQRAWLEGRNIPAHYVAVDLTQPGDGYDPEDYGLESLWATIEKVLPLGLATILKQTPEPLDQGGGGPEAKPRLRLMPQSDAAKARFALAHPRIWSHALAAGTAAAVPLPYFDVPVVMAIQGNMLRDLARIYNQPLSAGRVAEIASALGIGFLGRLGARELLKIVPGVGSMVAGAYAATYTYALGRTLCVYFEYLSTQTGPVPSPEVFRQVYQEEFEKSRELIKTYFQKANDWARNQHNNPPPNHP